MTEREKHIHDKDGRLIDRYLHRLLSGAELKDFEDRLRTDVSFRQRVEIRKSIVEGIRISADEVLTDKIMDALEYRRSLVPFGLKLLMAFIVILSAGLMVWNYIGENTSKKSRFFDIKAIIKPKSKSNPRPSETSGSAKRDSMMTDSTLVENTDSGLIVLDEDQVADSIVFDPDAEEIVVRKDQLLLSKTMNPKRSAQDEKQSSLASDAAKKLNPDAGLPEMDMDDPAYQVEFWVNPVNYKGYRFAGDRVILFGIENPDGCELASFNGSLYLKSAGEVFELMPSSDLRPYVPVRDMELLKSIR